MKNKIQFDLKICSFSWIVWILSHSRSNHRWIRCSNHKGKYHEWHEKYLTENYWCWMRSSFVVCCPCFSLSLSLIFHFIKIFNFNSKECNGFKLWRRIFFKMLVFILNVAPTHKLAGAWFCTSDSQLRVLGFCIVLGFFFGWSVASRNLHCSYHTAPYANIDLCSQINEPVYCFFSLFSSFSLSLQTFLRCEILGDWIQKSEQKERPKKGWRVKIFNYRTCGEDLNCFHHHRLWCAEFEFEWERRLVVGSSMVRLFFILLERFFSVVLSHFVLFSSSLCSCNFLRSFTCAFFPLLYPCLLSVSLFIRLFDFYVSNALLYFHSMPH